MGVLCLSIVLHTWIGTCSSIWCRDIDFHNQFKKRKLWPQCRPALGRPHTSRCQRGKEFPAAHLSTPRQAPRGNPLKTMKMIEKKPLKKKWKQCYDWQSPRGRPAAPRRPAQRSTWPQAPPRTGPPALSWQLRRAPGWEKVTYCPLCPIWQKDKKQSKKSFFDDGMSRLFQPCGTFVWQEIGSQEALAALGETQLGEEEPQVPASDQGSTLAFPTHLLASFAFAPQESYFASFFSASCRWDLVLDQRAHGVEVVVDGGHVLAQALARGSAPRRCAAQCSRTRLWTLSQSLFWRKNRRSWQLENLRSETCNLESTQSGFSEHTPPTIKQFWRYKV